jgi:hypothetical protein
MTRKLIGTVHDFGGIIAVSNDVGIPLHNFFSWSEFMKWINSNHFDFIGNMVTTPTKL